MLITISISDPEGPYAVQILKPEWTAQLLAVVIVIDRLQHNDRYSGVGD